LRQYFHFSEQDIDKAREDFEAGSDAPLKLLLFALFPRIRSLKCSRDSQVSGRDAFDVTGNAARRQARSHLDYIQRAIILHVEHGSSAWPVGFSSLRDLAVGVETGTDIDSFNALPPPHLFADLMHLPGLESIYFYGLTQYTDNQIADDQDGTVAPYNVDEGSSSLQHIFLDRAQGLSWKFRKAMISGCKQLKSLAISNSEMDDIDALVQDAANFHADSMETLMFYETDSLHGYRCNMFRPEALNNFRNLRTVYIDASDVMLDAFYNYKHDDHQHDETAKKTEHEWIADLDFFVEFFMSSSFPESTEVLVLGAQPSSRLSEADADFFDQAIATMIETMHEPEEDGGPGKESEGSQPSRMSFERRFGNLKAVYLGALDNIRTATRYDEPSPQPTQKGRFSRAIAAGRKAGVDVHTRATPRQPFHKIDFPTPPNVADLKSAPEPPQGPVVFDIYTGTWVDYEDAGGAIQ
jgi:hypothetical protein